MAKSQTLYAAIYKHCYFNRLINQTIIIAKHDQSSTPFLTSRRTNITSPEFTLNKIFLKVIAALMVTGYWYVQMKITHGKMFTRFRVDIGNDVYNKI